MSKPLLFKTQSGMAGCNTYVYGYEGEECVVIDLGSNRDDTVEKYIAKHHSECLGILLTHGHYDHLDGFKNLADPLRYKVYIGEEDIRCLFDAAYNASIEVFDTPFTIDENTDVTPLFDHDEIKVGRLVLHVISTPFHTAGSVCFYDKENGVLFSGDTLFRHGIGRYDLKGATPRFMSQSLKKLAALPADTKVYCGHGPDTSIEFEKKYNPSLR